MDSLAMGTVSTDHGWLQSPSCTAPYLGFGDASGRRSAAAQLPHSLEQRFGRAPPQKRQNSDLDTEAPHCGKGWLQPPPYRVATSRRATLRWTPP
jgi:hypothetical protein